MAVYRVRISEWVESTADIEVGDCRQADWAEVRTRLIEVAHEVAVETDRTVTSVHVETHRLRSTVDARLQL